MQNRADGTLPLTVDNTGFLLERLGKDCHPLQFLRELTQNSLQAIGRSSHEGEIVWDVDWNSYDLADTPVFKLSIVDTGDGMTGQEMERFINKLSSSLSNQSLVGNYGVGAKIAAATRNHHGLLYMSWKNGKGYMIHLWRDPETGQYGLRQIARPDQSFGHWAEVEDDVKPSIIREHGTMVVLLGNSADEDTMRAREGAPSPSRWIAKYLNSRFYRIPDGIKIRAREGWEHPRDDKDRNLLRTITGQERYLEQHAQSSGVVKLTNAVAHWWILKDETALTQNSGWVESSGHMAALYQNELYELASARSGRARLQNFGVLLGPNRVVIYVEPDADLEVTPNISRTQLLRESEPLPWAEWGVEFGENMPTEIRDLMDEVAARSTSHDHAKAIRERLKALLDMYRVSRYRPSPSGAHEIDSERRVRGGAPATGDAPSAPRKGSARSGGAGGSAGGIYSAFLKKGGASADQVNPDPFPEVKWLSTTDGTREPGDIEDRAARYSQEQNALLVNADFRVFRDMVERFKKEYGGAEATASTIEEAVRNWFEQALVETVIGVQAMNGSKEWSVSDVTAALSEVSLTACVMQRYHVLISVKRELGTKLGPSRRVA